MTSAPPTSIGAPSNSRPAGSLLILKSSVLTSNSNQSRRPPDASTQQLLPRNDGRHGQRPWRTIPEAQPPATPRPERGLPPSGTSAHLPDEHSLMTAGYSVCSTAAGIFATDIKERATWLSN